MLDEVPHAALGGIGGTGDVAAGEVGLGGDEQALRQLEIPLRHLRLDDGAVRRLDGLVEQVGLQQRAGVVEPHGTGERSFVSGLCEAGARTLEGVEGSRQVTDQGLDVGQVLVGDRRNQGLLEPRRLLDGLLEVDPSFGQAADLGEQRAEVDVDARLAELVGTVAEHLECRLVLDQRGIELALLVEDDPALEVE